MQNYVLVIDENLEVCKEIKYNLQDQNTEAYYTQSVEEARLTFWKKKLILLCKIKSPAVGGLRISKHLEI